MQAVTWPLQSHDLPSHMTSTGTCNPFFLFLWFAVWTWWKYKLKFRVRVSYFLFWLCKWSSQRAPRSKVTIPLPPSLSWMNVKNPSKENYLCLGGAPCWPLQTGKSGWVKGQGLKTVCPWQRPSGRSRRPRCWSWWAEPDAAMLLLPLVAASGCEEMKPTLSPPPSLLRTVKSKIVHAHTHAPQPTPPPPPRRDSFEDDVFVWSTFLGCFSGSFNSHVRADAICPTIIFVCLQAVNKLF